MSQTSKAPLEDQMQGTNLFTSAAPSQRGCPEGSPKEVPARFPEGQSFRGAQSAQDVGPCWPQSLLEWTF